jgi:hypothetical protein
MKVALWNGREGKLSVIIAPLVVSRSLEVHNNAEPVKSGSPRNWMALFDFFVKKIQHHYFRERNQVIYGPE